VLSFLSFAIIDTKLQDIPNVVSASANSDISPDLGVVLVSIVGCRRELLKLASRRCTSRPHDDVANIGSFGLAHVYSGGHPH
jgi:hypothetical protein